MNKPIAKKEIMKQHKVDCWSYLFAQCHDQLGDDLVDKNESELEYDYA